jgi:hypothetical protein
MWDLASTSTMYDSVAYSKVLKVCVLDSRWCLWWNSVAKIQELTTSLCSISQTVQTDAFADQGCFPSWEVINWSCSFPCTIAVHYIVRWLLSTLIWSYSHPITCYVLFFLLSNIYLILKRASWVIFSVATIAMLQRTNLYLHCCCASPGETLVEAPVVRLNLDPITPGWCISGAMASSCGKVRNMIMKRSGKSWRLYS